MEDIRDTIRHLMKKRHINVSSFAKEVGIDKQVFYDCFSHRRRLEATELVKICFALGLTLKDFVYCVELKWRF